MLCIRCELRESTKNDDGLCAACRHTLKRSPGAQRRPWQDGMKGLSEVERFWAKVDKRGPDECWLWQGRIDRDGYGRFTYDGSDKPAHRYAYRLIIGPILNDWPLDHVKARGCNHKNCVNPAHLEPVTPRENNLRGNTLPAINAAKTHCKRGHEFTVENTIAQKYPDGRYKGRLCRTCRNGQQMTRYYDKKKAPSQEPSSIT